MTSKISLVKLARQKLSQNIWLLAASFLALFFTSPLIIFMEITDQNWANYYVTLENFSNHLCSTLVNNYAVSCITIAAAFIVPLVLFRYINSKSEVDFYHSLPIKRDKFFIVNYLLGLLIFIIPFLLNTALSVIIIRANVPFMPEFTTELSNFVACVLLSYIAIYSVNIFATIITGNIFMSVATGLGFMFLLATIVSVSSESLNILLNNYYINQDFIELMWQHTNPLISIVNSYSLSDDKNLTGCIITALIYTVLAFLLYKNRRSENASNPVAFDYLKPVIKFIGVFGATLLGGFIFYSFTRESILWYFLGALLVAFIVHCAFEIIYESDFKALFCNFNHFIVYAGIVVLVFTSINLDLIGFDQTIPDISDIGHIEISDDSYVYSQNTTIICEVENIETVHKIAQLCIENSANPEQNGSFYVKYYLKNGKTITRQYKNIDIEVVDSQLYFELFSSDEFIQKTNHRLVYDTKYIADIQLNNTTLNKAEIEEFYTTYMQEYTEISNDYFRYNMPVYAFYVSLNSSDDTEAYNDNYSRFYVYECQKDTLALISKYDDFSVNIDDCYEIELINGNYSTTSSTVFIDNEQLFDKICQDTIPSKWTYTDIYIPFSSSEVVRVRFKYEQQSSSYGYINPDLASYYLDTYFSA